MAIKRKFPARTATVLCSGGCRAKRDENGGLLCAYGSVACGACVEACRFGAVQINDLGCAEVDEEKCIGCGACARKCPRGLIDLRRTEDRIAVLCSNRDKGFDPATKTGARTVCDVSCIGCGLCVKKCPADAIHVFPVIYSNTLQGIKSADGALLEMARVYRVPFSRRLGYIYAPQVKPFLLSGCSVALGMSWKSGVAAEVIGVVGGSIGERLYEAKVYFQMTDLLAWTVVIVVCSVGFEKLVLWLLRRCFAAWEGR